MFTNFAKNIQTNPNLKICDYKENFIRLINVSYIFTKNTFKKLTVLYLFERFQRPERDKCSQYFLRQSYSNTNFFKCKFARHRLMQLSMF